MRENTKTKTKRRYARQPDRAIDGTPASPSESAVVRKVSKIGKVVDLLQRAEGATLNEIVETTGWQPHSARASLTGLKKKGHTIEKVKRDDVTCYRIGQAL